MQIASAQTGPTPHLPQPPTPRTEPAEPKDAPQNQSLACRLVGCLRKTREDRSAFFRVMAYFRETNAEAQRIRERLQDAVRLLPCGEQAARHAFDQARHVIRKEIEEAKHRARPVEKLRETDPETFAWCAREWVQVTDGWDDLDRLWPTPPAAKEPLASLAECAKESIKKLSDVIFICACLTIPNELDNYLANYRVGKSLDFLATFKDQLPDEESARRVLASLAPESGVVSGLIDLDGGKVIKADHRLWRQLASLAMVASVAAMGFGFAGIAVHWGPWFHFDTSGWPLKQNQWAALNGAYLLVLLGALGHWVLDRVKQNHAGTDITPLAEWLIWIHINEIQICSRIATSWLVVGLGVAFKVFDLAEGVQPLTYFTAGYFLDSTFDALVGRFNTFMGDKDPGRKKARNSAN